MATATQTSTESHLSREEVARLARSKPSGKARLGVIASYVGDRLVAAAAG